MKPKIPTYVIIYRIAQKCYTFNCYRKLILAFASNFPYLGFKHTKLFKLSLLHTRLATVNDNFHIYLSRCLNYTNRTVPQKLLIHKPC